MYFFLKEFDIDLIKFKFGIIIKIILKTFEKSQYSVFLKKTGENFNL